MPHTTHRSSKGERSRRTSAACLPLPVRLFGQVLGHGARLLCIGHVSFTRFVDLFPPSLGWVPWPPHPPWPCGSPLSSVLWVRKTAPSPFRAISVSLDFAYLLFFTGDGELSQVPGESLCKRALG